MLSQYTRAKALLEHSKDHFHKDLAILIWGEEKGLANRAAVSRLVRACREACPQLLEAWRMERVPTGWVMDTAKNPPAVQEMMLSRRLSKEPKKRGSYGRPAVDDVRRALSVVDASPPFGSGIRSALEWVLGHAEDLNVDDN